VTVVLPIVATRDFRGTDCLGCHVAEEGAVLGATRVTYSLATLDRRIAASLMASGGLNVLLLTVGVVAILWLLRRIVIRPLCEMRATMGLIEADADLTLRLRVDSQDEIGSLSGACNQMLGHFGASLGEVSETSHRLSVMAERITGVSAKTAGAALQQRAETDAVADAIAQLDATSQGVRDGAASASDASVEADQAAVQGVATTRSAIEGIHAMLAELAQVSEVIERLDQRSQRVGDVLDVIKSIAEQTNLLALNAAIEAARAGDKGRGFAVVADEVRTLANRSHESTSDIEAIIEHLQLGARDAVAAVRHATASGEARREEVESAGLDLVRITEQVGRIRELNAGMAAAASSQRAVVEDVNRNVSTISLLAERTAADAGEAASVSADLQALAARLEELVRRFRFSA
jgi:methyl-accepting chemotaxis protein